MDARFTSGAVVSKVGDDPNDPALWLVVMSIDVAGRSALCRAVANNEVRIIPIVNLHPAATAELQVVDDESSEAFVY